LRIFSLGVQNEFKKNSPLRPLGFPIEATQIRLFFSVLFTFII
jgi:hypothetical protein